MAKALQITARPEKGFRRAGIHHPASPVIHPLATLKKEQIDALKAEPNLVVVEVDLPDAPIGGDDAAAKGEGGKKK